MADRRLRFRLATNGCVIYGHRSQFSINELEGDPSKHSMQVVVSIMNACIENEKLEPFGPEGLLDMFLLHNGEFEQEDRECIEEVFLTTLQKLNN